jgi:K+-sensing histidine kinase KdpD
MVIISDEGKGFSEKKLELLNDKDLHTSVHSEGSGIGLAVSRRFVNLLNGELKFSNKKEGGAEVVLLLNQA